MIDFKENDVVICGTMQAGTVITSIKREIWVLLRNGDIWVGPASMCRLPQDKSDLDACPIDVERLEPKRMGKEDRTIQ